MPGARSPIPPREGAASRQSTGSADEYLPDPTLRTRDDSENAQFDRSIEIPTGNYAMPHATFTRELESQENLKIHLDSRKKMPDLIFLSKKIDQYSVWATRNGGEARVSLNISDDVVYQLDAAYQADEDEPVFNPRALSNEVAWRLLCEQGAPRNQDEFVDLMRKAADNFKGDNVPVTVGDMDSMRNAVLTYTRRFEKVLKLAFQYVLDPAEHMHYREKGESKSRGISHIYLEPLKNFNKALYKYISDQEQHAEGHMNMERLFDIVTRKVNELAHEARMHGHALLKIAASVPNAGDSRFGQRRDRDRDAKPPGDFKRRDGKRPFYPNARRTSPGARDKLHNLEIENSDSEAEKPSRAADGYDSEDSWSDSFASALNNG